MTGNESRTVKRKYVVLAVTLVLVAIIFAGYIGRPSRSVTSFCDVFAQEDARLAKLPGDTWPSGVFKEDISDAGEFAESFSRLEKVAPEDIRADVATIQAIYEKIDEDPSQAIAASLSGIDAEEAVIDWIEANCSENN